MFINWITLQKRAELARDRIDADSDGGRSYGSLDALDSIILSVVTLEAFINEVREMADGYDDEAFPALSAFAKIQKEVEDSKGSLKLKYRWAHQIFTGNSYDDSRYPYQDFNILLDLRNSIVHYKPLGKFENNPDGKIMQRSVPMLEKLRSKNILSNVTIEKKSNPKILTNWLYEISTRKAANWACATSSDVIQSILSIFPECPLKSMIIESIEFTKERES